MCLKIFKILNRYLKTGTPEKKVQELFEKHYNEIFANGERDYKKCDICNAI